MKLPKIGKLIKSGVVAPPNEMTNLMHILRRTLTSKEEALSGDDLAALVDSHDLENPSETASRDRESDSRRSKSRRPEG